MSSQFEHFCGLAAYHATEIMTAKAPATIKCGLHNPLNPRVEVNVRITIEKGNLSESAGDVWDQVYIALDKDPPDFKGDWCGNRCGGRNTLMELYADVLRDIVLYEEGIKHAK